ncbi:SurA N-terminal domain-containing protein [Candidatus Daviesbacteria bacterium]|nr:SurA N-terminal domain-containing protein [Candidatus Daviesbacteria bacterium]
MVKKAQNSKVKIQNLISFPGGKLNNFLNTIPETIAHFRSSKTFYLILLAVGILLLAIFKKGWFVAASVNGAPITNLELQSKLNQQFRTQTLNQLINEKIILSEAGKNMAIPIEQDIDKRIAELETNVGGKSTLDTLLSQQGQTRASLKDQIRVQLAITKMYEKEATVSAEEVTKFLENNRQSLQATESAAQEKEAYDSLKSQKLSQIFSQKFQELKNKAKIQIF